MDIYNNFLYVVQHLVSGSSTFLLSTCYCCSSLCKTFICQCSIHLYRECWKKQVERQENNSPVRKLQGNSWDNGVLHPGNEVFHPAGKSLSGIESSVISVSEPNYLALWSSMKEFAFPLIKGTGKTRRNKGLLYSKIFSLKNFALY